MNQKYLILLNLFEGLLLLLGYILFKVYPNIEIEIKNKIGKFIFTLICIVYIVLGFILSCYDISMFFNDNMKVFAREILFWILYLTLFFIFKRKIKKLRKSTKRLILPLALILSYSLYFIP